MTIFVALFSNMRRRWRDAVERRQAPAPEFDSPALQRGPPMRWNRFRLPRHRGGRSRTSESRLRPTRPTLVTLHSASQFRLKIAPTLRHDSVAA